MAWALRFLSSDSNQCVFGSTIFIDSTEKLSVIVEVDGLIAGERQYIFGRPTANNSSMEFFGDGRVFITGRDSNRLDLSLTTAKEDIQKIELIVDGLGCELWINDSLEDSGTLSSTTRWFIQSIAKSSIPTNINVKAMSFYKDDVLIHNYSAEESDRSNTGQQPVLIDTIGGNNATGVNFPTDGSAWVDLGGGGSIDVTGQTANYNYSAIPGSVELAGEITVTGGTANYNYSGLNGSVELTGEIVVNGQTANYNCTGLNGSVLLQGQINVIGQTASYDYTGLNASVLLSGEIVVTGQTANYDYFGVGATINLFDIWQIKDPVSTNWTAKDKELTDWGIKDPVTTVWSKK